jgi:hypothetical protein
VKITSRNQYFPHIPNVASKNMIWSKKNIRLPRAIIMIFSALPATSPFTARKLKAGKLDVLFTKKFG